MSSFKRDIKEKRKRLSLKEKIDVIEKSKSMPMQELAKKFDSASSTIYNILHKQDELTNLWMESQNPESRNKMRETRHEKVNVATLNWLRVAQSEGVLVSGPMLQEQARIYAVHYNDPDFKASNGWLHSFKRRNLMVFNAMYLWRKRRLRPNSTYKYGLLLTIRN